MLVNKTIQLDKDIRSLNTILARAKKEFLDEIVDIETKDIDFCKHYILLNGIEQSDLVIIHHYIDQNFRLKIKARKCTIEEHNEYLKKKWSEEPKKRSRDSYNRKYNTV